MNLHLEPDSLRIAIPFPDEIRCAGNHGHDKRSPLRGIARSGCQREVDTPGLSLPRRVEAWALSRSCVRLAQIRSYFVWTIGLELRQITPAEADLR